MSKAYHLYSKCAGLNYGVRPQDLLWNQDTSTVELAQCLDIHVTPSGKICRLPAWNSVDLLSLAHTLFSDKRTFVGVGVNLYELVNGQLLPVKDDGTGNEISICVYGEDAYCCDGEELFVINNEQQIRAWETEATKVGIPSSRVYANPMPHTKAVNAFGRVFILIDDYILAGSDPIGPAMFDFSGSLLYDTNKYKNLASLQSLILVGTETQCYSIGKDFQRTVISNTPVINNTMAKGYINGNQVIMFMLRDGIYITDESGQVTKVSEDKINAEELQLNVRTASLYDDYYRVFDDSYVFTFHVPTKTLTRQSNTVYKAAGKYTLQNNYFCTISGAQNIDELVESKVIFPAVDLDTHYAKYMRKVVFSGYFTGTVVWTLMNEVGDTHSVTIETTGEYLRDRKIEFPYTLRGRYLQLQLQVNGAFVLDDVYFIPVIKNQRTF